MSSSPIGEGSVGAIGGDAKSGGSLLGGTSAFPSGITFGPLASGPFAAAGPAMNADILTQLMKALGVQRGGGG